MDVAERYARALERSELDEAYALTSAEFRARLSREQFEQRYASDAARRDRAAEVREASGALTAQAPELKLVREGEAWRIAEPDAMARTPAGEAKVALRRFVDAVEAEDFAAAYALLAAPLRARYTPERFAEDFRREPLADERLTRARAALTAPPEKTPDGFAFPISDGKAVELVREPDGYRLVAIE